MANDVVLNPGAGGPDVATDEIGGRHYQWIKLGYGGEDAFTPIDVGTGLPVRPSSNGTPGSAPPGEATLIAGSDGTLLQLLSVDTSGRLVLRAAGALAAAAPDRALQAGGKDGSGNLQPFKVNAGGAQIVEHSVTNLGSGRKTVTTAGTAVAISAAAVAKAAWVTAFDSNLGVIVVGDSAVLAASGTRRGGVLHPGDSAIVPCDDLSDIYIDAENSGEGVSFTSLT